MARLIGRSRELCELERAWERARDGDPRLVVLWGRRRVGKTFLLTHFCADRPALYFTATRQDSERRQVERYAQAVREQLGEDVADLMGGGFTDWEAALRFTLRIAADRPLVVVLDEAPRLLAGRPDFADLVSAVWEARSAGTRILLVLTGSAVSVIEDMLGPQGGLHRRASWEHRLDPFGLAEAREFLPSAPAAGYIEAYAACGGYPLHLRRWDADRSREENLRELAFTPGGLLLRDAQDILSEDLDWRGGYERVLGALGAGTRRRSRIASRAQQRIDYTLDRLRRAGYVRAARPHGAPPTADPLYEITDPYLAFWFSVLRDDADLVEGGQGAAVQTRTDGRWQAHVARVFEQAARDHAVRLVAEGALPAELTVGRWWRDETVEIDVLGLLDTSARLVGEAKWQAGPLDLRALHSLRARSRHLPELHPDLTFAFWARGGASADFRGQSDVAVHTPKDMV